MNKGQKILLIIFIFVIASFSFFKTGNPTIYKDIDHSEEQLISSIDNLMEASTFDLTLSLSDNILAKVIRRSLPKYKQLHFDYYYVIDYTIDSRLKRYTLKSISIEEWYQLKNNKDSRKILKDASSILGPDIPRQARLEELEKIKWQILLK